MVFVIIGGLLCVGYFCVLLVVVELFEFQCDKLYVDFGIMVLVVVDESLVDVGLFVWVVKLQMFVVVVVFCVGVIGDVLQFFVMVGICSDVIVWVIGSEWVVCVMFNMLVLIGQGIVGFFVCVVVLVEDKVLVEQVLVLIGMSLWVGQEMDLDVVIVFLGFGLVYFFYIVEVMMVVVVDMGLMVEQGCQFVFVICGGVVVLGLQLSELLVVLCEWVMFKGGMIYVVIISLQIDWVGEVVQWVVKVVQVCVCEFGDEFGG